MSTEKLMSQIITLALEEDIEQGDITTEALIPGNMGGRAIIIAQQEGVLCGSEIARMVFLQVDREAKVEILAEEGQSFKKGDVILAVMGRVHSIMKGERTALNFLSRLSGISTLTARYVDAVRDSDVDIKDTRKTYPGNRILEKYAVYVGGGKNHRPHLAGGVIIKDTHIKALLAKKISIKEALQKARNVLEEKKLNKLQIEIECNTLNQVEEAIQGNPDVIMLDNMSSKEMKKAVDLIPEEIEVEASGNITLTNIKEIASNGVDSISVGAITHSATALDFSLSFA